MNEEQRENFRNYYHQKINELDGNIVENADRIFEEYCVINNVSNEKNITRYDPPGHISEKDVISIDRHRVHLELRIDHLF